MNPLFPLTIFTALFLANTTAAPDTCSTTTTMSTTATTVEGKVTTTMTTTTTFTPVETAIAVAGSSTEAPITKEALPATTTPAMSIMHVVPDAAAGASGDMSMIAGDKSTEAHAITETPQAMHHSKAFKESKSGKTSKSIKSTNRPSVSPTKCPEQPQPTCASEMIRAITQHPVQMKIEVDDNEFMLVWTGPTNKTITVEFPGGCVCNGTALTVGGAGAGGYLGGGGGAGGGC